MVSSFHGLSETMVSSFHRCGILTFKVLEVRGCGRFHGFIVSLVSETIWAGFSNHFGSILRPGGPLGDHFGIILSPGGPLGEHFGSLDGFGWSLG